MKSIVWNYGWLLHDFLHPELFKPKNIQSITPNSLPLTSSCVPFNVNLKFFIISLDFNHIKWHRLASSIKLFALLPPWLYIPFSLVHTLFLVITCLHLRDWFIETFVEWMHTQQKGIFWRSQKRFIDQTVCYVENVNNRLVPR